MDLEKKDFTKMGIRFNILGNIDAFYSGKKYNFEEINHDCKIQKKDNRYYLIVPTDINEKHSTKTNDCISLDPGVKTFLTGISKNKIVKI